MSADSTTFVVTLLEPAKHDRAAFSCGEPSLDTYLQRQASQDLKRRAAVTYVMTERKEAGHIMGYYTLSATSVKLSDIPQATQKKLARYPDVPASLIGRLAIGEQHKGQGLGAQLLRHALLQSLAQSQALAIAVVVVDALNDDAKRFYEHYGFVPVASEGSRLYLPMKTIAQSMG